MHGRCRQDFLYLCIYIFLFLYIIYIVDLYNIDYLYHICITLNVYVATLMYFNIWFCIYNRAAFIYNVFLCLSMFNAFNDSYIDNTVILLCTRYTKINTFVREWCHHYNRTV